MYLSWGVPAAHCTWKVNASTLQVVLGKFYRDFEMNQELTEVKDVRIINLLPCLLIFGLLSCHVQMFKMC
jgi:hypothetical protein